MNILLYMTLLINLSCVSVIFMKKTRKIETSEKLICKKFNKQLLINPYVLIRCARDVLLLKIPTKQEPKPEGIAKKLPLNLLKKLKHFRKLENLKNWICKNYKIAISSIKKVTTFIRKSLNSENAIDFLDCYRKKASAYIQKRVCKSYNSYENELAIIRFQCLQSNGHNKCLESKLNINLTQNETFNYLCSSKENSSLFTSAEMDCGYKIINNYEYCLDKKIDQLWNQIKSKQSHH